ncbi:cobyrinate a,c-diamide synthase [Desulfatiglans anilini]|uniref:cobyrinate a,c-diamide synthase n=1 Tax=Desulfatiglans anilini TaxID=90728 RepID=UPI000554562F|nr:cobyrinate a,c-diamide synthase [Desulfatiglans anilini]
MYLIPPRISISALRGGSGKTLLSLGLASAWEARGLSVAPFKKGPDFIDAGWMSFAAGRPCRNLDPFLMTREQVIRSFALHASGLDCALVEGNRGLFDGLDVTGCCSTAELAKWLRSPVILVVDVTMSTRTVAAVVKGCQVFDPDLRVCGVILNRVAGPRQENLVREAVATYCGIPVVGSVPKLGKNLFPERHMGLVPHQEREEGRRAVAWTKEVVETHVDLAAIEEIMARQGSGDLQVPEEEASSAILPLSKVRIGYILDRSFWFYYPENLEALERLGARLIRLDAMEDPALPPLDGLYIGGGFPETQAAALAANAGFRTSLRSAVEKGLPVYAECGGLMYLGEALEIEQAVYPMVGALPVAFELMKRPQGHGYTVLRADAPNPFFKEGTVIRGHEFHYSRPRLTRPLEARFAFKVERGHGIDGVRDGLWVKNLLGVYTHVHAAGDDLWARRLVEMAREFGGTDREFFHE